MKNNEKMETTEKKKNKPRMIIENIEVEMKEADDIKETIYKQNDIINMNFEMQYFKENFKIRTHLRNKINNDTKKIRRSKWKYKKSIIKR